MNEQGQFGELNLLDVLSLWLGVENLMENREQSKHNDVENANNRQARKLLRELDKRFREQNEILEYQNDLLEELTDQMERQNRMLKHIIDRLDNAG